MINVLDKWEFGGASCSAGSTRPWPSARIRPRLKLDIPLFAKRINHYSPMISQFSSDTAEALHNKSGTEHKKHKKRTQEAQEELPILIPSCAFCASCVPFPESLCKAPPSPSRGVYALWSNI